MELLISLLILCKLAVVSCLVQVILPCIF